MSYAEHQLQQEKPSLEQGVASQRLVSNKEELSSNKGEIISNKKSQDKSTCKTRKCFSSNQKVIQIAQLRARKCTGRTRRSSTECKSECEGTYVEEEGCPQSTASNKKEFLMYKMVLHTMQLRKRRYSRESCFKQGNAYFDKEEVYFQQGQAPQSAASNKERCTFNSDKFQ